MADEPELASEHQIVSARMSGAASVEASFECLYRLYAPVVAGWLAIRVELPELEDLLQDVWTVFYQRWRTWRQSDELDTPAARPVLSFLYRTVHFATKAHRRARQKHESIDGVDPPDERTCPQRLLQNLIIGRCLELARTHCSAEDVEILVGKLAGVPAREIARAHGISEASVDHRYRNALGRLRRKARSMRSEEVG